VRGQNYKKKSRKDAMTTTDGASGSYLNKVTGNSFKNSKGRRIFWKKPGRRTGGSEIRRRKISSMEIMESKKRTHWRWMFFSLIYPVDVLTSRQAI